MTKNLYKGFSVTKHVRHKHSVNMLTLLYICSAFLKGYAEAWEWVKAKFYAKPSCMRKRPKPNKTKK